MTGDPDAMTTRIIARQGPRDLPFRRDGAPDVAGPGAPKASGSASVDVAPVVAPPIVPPPAAAAAPVPPRPAMTTPKAHGLASVLVPPVVGAPRPQAAPAQSAREPAQAPARPPEMPETSPFIVQTPVAPAETPVVPPAVAASGVIEPVVGWLVVVRGPGRGASVALHGGRNALGSGPDQDLRIDFGDAAIAACGHAYLAYDEEARSFFIEDGKKKDLVRLNGQMLSETRPLADGDEIRIGRTTLRFKALCGPSFDWSDDASDTPT